MMAANMANETLVGAVIGEGDGAVRALADIPAAMAL